MRGAFWENHGSAYRSQPSKGFEEVLTSPFLKSFHPSKRATSCDIQEHLTCLSLTTAVQTHRCKAVVRSGSGSWEMFNQGALSPPTYTLETVHSRNFSFSAFFCLEMPLSPSLTPPHGPVTNLASPWLCLPSQGCGCYLFLRRILTAHGGEIFLVFTSRSQFDKEGYKFFELLSLHSQVCQLKTQDGV